MTRQHNTCASCEKFPLEASMDSGGAAQCSIFERRTEWDSRACVLHDVAQDVRQRKVLVIRLHEQQPKEK